MSIPLPPTLRDDEIRRIAAIVAAELVVSTADAARTLAQDTAAAAKSAAGSMTTDILYIKRDLEEIKDRLDSKYVSVDVFEPVKRLVYGLVALMLSSIVMSIIMLVVVKK